jgi:hypothetical protein
VGWGLARELPGLATLAAGKSVQPQALSCSAAGECALGGSYTDSSGRTQAFVAAERGGTWGSAVEVPGTAALNHGGAAAVTSVSCPAPGDCAAAGHYSPGASTGSERQPAAEAFVVTERGGRWGPATPLPGLAALNVGQQAGAGAISCWAAGDCAVAGTYATAVRGRDLVTQGFVAAQRGGRWGPATALPGLAALNVGGQAEVSALSCAPARVSADGSTGRSADKSAGTGDCAVGGEYGAATGTGAYVAERVNGTWRPAEVFPGTDTGAGGAAHVSSISCSSAGDCAAAGSYTNGSGSANAGTRAATGFVADSRAGRWGTPRPMPGTDIAVSCASPGNCAAGGTRSAPAGSAPVGQDAFVAAETNGRWGAPGPVPGLAGLDTGRDAGIVAVSCSPAGTCGVGGSYATPRPGASDHAFIATASHGTWSKARSALSGPQLILSGPRRTLPGARIAGSGNGDSAVTLMSCASPSACTAAGFDSGGAGVFVLSTAPGRG